MYALNQSKCNLKISVALTVQQGNRRFSFLPSMHFIAVHKFTALNVTLYVSSTYVVYCVTIAFHITIQGVSVVILALN